MSKSKTSSPGNAGEKSSARLQKALDETCELLKEEEKKLTKCQKQLAETKARLAGQESLPGKTETLEKELSEARQQLQAEKLRSERLEAELEEIRRLNRNLEAEKAELFGKLEAAVKKDDQVSEVEALEKKSRQPEGKRQELSRPDAELQKIPAKTSQRSAFREINFRQVQRLLEPGSPLKANQPFSVIARLQFPVVPSAKNMNVDTSGYDVGIIATDEQEREVLFRTGVAKRLSPGVAEYENELRLNGLKPGKYLFRVYTLALFAGVEETRKIALQVE